MIPLSSAGAVVVDANVFISLCAKEPTFAIAEKALADYASRGWTVHAPNVVVAEVLYVLCLKHQNGLLTPSAYEDALRNFEDQMKAVLPPPNGDAELIGRATEIQDGYGCSRSADGLYIALVEKLALAGPAEFLTFDKGAVNQITKKAPGVVANLLPV